MKEWKNSAQILMTAAQSKTAQTMSAKNAEAVRAGKDSFPSKKIFKR